MCVNCEIGNVGRRTLLKMSAAGIVALALGGSPSRTAVFPFLVGELISFRF